MDLDIYLKGRWHSAASVNLLDAGNAGRRGRVRLQRGLATAHSAIGSCSSGAPSILSVIFACGRKPNGTKTRTEGSG